MEATTCWLPVEPPADLAESLELLLQVEPDEVARIIREIQEYERPFTI